MPHPADSLNISQVVIFLKVSSFSPPNPIVWTMLRTAIQEINWNKHTELDEPYTQLHAHAINAPTARWTQIVSRLHKEYIPKRGLYHRFLLRLQYYGCIYHWQYAVCPGQTLRLAKVLGISLRCKNLLSLRVPFTSFTVLCVCSIYSMQLALTKPFGLPKSSKYL